MKPLESRKHLLVAESELNRAQLVQEWGALAGEARTLARQARTVSCLASAAASLVGGLFSLRFNKPPPAAAKPPWWQEMLKGAGLVATLWQSFRRLGTDRAGK